MTQIPCLEEVLRQIEVSNISPIPAVLHLSLRGRSCPASLRDKDHGERFSCGDSHSFYRLQDNEILLEAGKSTVLNIAAKFEEPQKSVEQLLLDVLDGGEISVTLKGQVIKTRLKIC